MAKIISVHPRTILDSRGQETLEVDVVLNDGNWGRASVPSGASTSRHEAFKIEDMSQAKINVEMLAPLLIGQDPIGQERIDLTLMAQDQTENKSNIGANVMLAISLAIVEAGAKAAKKPLYQHIHDLTGIGEELRLPTPMFNVINGGKHADNNLEFQEFMLVPTADDRPYHQKLMMGAQLFYKLKEILLQMGHSVAVGDEGGFAPRLHSNQEAMEVLVRTIEQTPHEPHQDISIALDVAASAISDLTPVTFPLDPHAYFIKLVNEYPLTILEDPLTEDDWQGWQKLTAAIGNQVLIVGDDLYTTNLNRLKIGIEKKASNAVVIMPDQIGTLTETIRAIRLAHEANMTTIISHRSGETESTFIADLAVGVGAKYIKTGAPSRGERVAKYNQLLRIEEELGH